MNPTPTKSRLLDIIVLHLYGWRRTILPDGNPGWTRPAKTTSSLITYTRTGTTRYALRHLVD